jgi:hypothetical protein
MMETTNQRLSHCACGQLAAIQCEASSFLVAALMHMSVLPENKFKTLSRLQAERLFGSSTPGEDCMSPSSFLLVAADAN